MKKLPEIIIGTTITLIVVFTAIAFLLAWKEHSKQEECRDRGGYVERFNYRTIFIAESCGSGCTVMVPHQVSDWRCVGQKAERE
jgi:hypothetical protein